MGVVYKAEDTKPNAMILKNLRKALATFAGQKDTGHGDKSGEKDPTRPEEELLESLKEAIALVRSFLTERGASLDAIITQTGFARNAAIVGAKEAANENDEARKRFEVMCREVFNKFRACITIDGVNEHRHDRDAVNIIYKSLQDDRKQADISDIIRELHKVVEEAITTKTPSGDPIPPSLMTLIRVTKSLLKVDSDCSKLYCADFRRPFQRDRSSFVPIAFDQTSVICGRCPADLGLEH
jgi:hypothetical protein